MLCLLCTAFAVYKAICKRSREVVVLKCYLMSSICELYQHQIYREVRLHSTCNHENIINLFAAFQVRALRPGLWMKNNRLLQLLQ